MHALKAVVFVSDAKKTLGTKFPIRILIEIPMNRAFNLFFILLLHRLLCKNNPKLLKKQKIPGLIIDFVDNDYRNKR